MKKSFKAALGTILAVCLAASVLAGCAQTGQERAQDLDGTNDGMNNGAQNQGYNRNDLVGAGYGRNMTGNGYNYGTGNTNRNFTGNPNGNTNGNMIGFNGYGNGSTTGNTTGNDTQRAAKIERQLESMNGVNDCTVLVNGNTALIGLKNIRSNAGNISGLRSSIERRVRQADPSITNVRITNSPDVLSRMGRMGKAGNNGMTDNFMEEFNKLMNSISGTAG